MNRPNSEEPTLLVIERFKAGDPEAFETWYTAIEPQLQDALQHALRDPHNPQDPAVMQQQIQDRIRMTHDYLLAQGLYMYDPASTVSLSTYTQTIARNVADYALVQRFLHGDQEAFETWYAAIEPQFRGFLRGLGLDDPDHKGVEENVVGSIGEILQMTQLYLLERGFARYDPARGSLRQYTKSLLKYRAWSYFHQQQQWGWIQVIRLDPTRETTDVAADMETWLVGHSRAYKHQTDAQSEEQRYLDLTVKPQLAAQLLDTLLQLAFDPALHPPHQALAFGFVHLCRDVDRADTTPSHWPPRRLVAELTDTALQQLQAHLEALLTASFDHLPPAAVTARFNALHQQLGKRVAEVVEDLHRHTPRATQAWATSFAKNVLQAQGHPPEQAAIARTLAQWVVGHTCWRQYYTRKPEDNITDWCRSVQRRVFPALLAKGDGPLYEDLLNA